MEEDRGVVVSLSARERDVLRGVASGRTNVEIAADLGIGYETVKTYLARLRSKLGLRGVHAGARRRAELVALARCLLEVDDALEVA